MKVYELTTNKQIEQLAEKFPKRLLIIDFWAPWCGPCIEMKPLFEKYAHQHQDGIFISINIDNDNENNDNNIKEIYNIVNIPLFIFIKGNTVIDYLIGTDEIELLNKINLNLKKTMPVDILERPAI